jgi:hypothetical protein
MKSLLLAVASVAAAATLLSASCRGIPTFLIDPDLDDDGVVTQADVDTATACLGTVLPTAPISYDPGGCPVRPAPDATGCAAADVDRDGRVATADVAAITAQLGAPVCNGATELCGRRFDQVAYATTHNAMSARFPPYNYNVIISNQCSGVPTQLGDGIRALMLDIHFYFPEGAEWPDLYLCHAECNLGYQLLIDGLTEIRVWLDAHPAEVISFIIETDADTVNLEHWIRDAFVASGLEPYAHVQTPGTPWPTLAEMIAANHRLVVLTDDASPHTLCDADGMPCPWYQYLWSSLAFETHFSYSRPSDFSCVDNRGAPGNDLFILNHFLTNNTGAPSYAQQVNHGFLLSSRARECWSYQGRIPNFVTVDFYEIGDVLRITNLLNYLWGATGGAAP